MNAFDTQIATIERQAEMRADLLDHCFAQIKRAVKSGLTSVRVGLGGSAYVISLTQRARHIPDHMVTRHGRWPRRWFEVIGVTDVLKDEGYRVVVKYHRGSCSSYGIGSCEGWSIEIYW